jgi:hypothetical protein
MNEWLELIDNKLTKDEIFIHPDYVTRVNKDMKQMALTRLIDGCISEYYNYYPIKAVRGNTRFIYVDINVKSDTWNDIFISILPNIYCDKFYLSRIESNMLKNLRIDIGG